MFTLRLAALLLILASTSFADDTEKHHHKLSASDLGSVDFQTSCASATHAAFNRGVALLHSFEYGEARGVFQQVAAQDSSCAMAYWGIAMSRFHGLWGEFNAAEGKAAVVQAEKIAASAAHTTAREKQYIAAISEIYADAALKRADRPDNKPNSEGYSAPDRESKVAYAAKMSELHRDNARDDEAAIFYALSLDQTAVRAKNDYANEKQCDDVLEPLFKKLPNHPGVAHYLIHCNDSPAMSQRGLAAAREYAKIAPASAHATHMPSHIFIQVGDWKATEEMNRKSLEAAKNDKDASACERAGHMLHALHFMMYALVQNGQMAEASKASNRSEQINTELPGTDKCDLDLAFNPAWYSVTASDWKVGAKLAPTSKDPFQRTSVFFASGLGAAHAGDHAGAEKAVQELAGLRDQIAKTNPRGAKNAAEVFRLWVEAADAESSRKSGDALALYRQAADLQDEISLVGGVWPSARQALGELLLRSGHAKEALAEFNQEEKLWPNRFGVLYGSAQAAETAGDRAAASAYYQKLLSVVASNERPEIATARQRVAALSRPKATSGGQ